MFPVQLHLVPKHLVTAAGLASMNSQAACCLLGICSTRVARKVLQFWRERLTVRERSLLMDYSQQWLTLLGGD